MFTPEMTYKRIPESILSANISWSHKFLTYDFRYGCYPSQLAWLLLHVCSSPNRTYLALLFNNWIMVWDLDRARVGILYRRITRSSFLCYDDPRSFPGTESNPIKLFRASYPLQIIKKAHWSSVYWQLTRWSNCRPQRSFSPLDHSSSFFLPSLHWLISLCNSVLIVKNDPSS